MFVKSLAPVIGFICAAIAVVPVAEAGCGHRHGGGSGYSSYQSRPSGAYAAQLRAQRKAEARAAAARRAKVAAARTEKARVAKAEANAEAVKSASATPAASKADTAETGSIAKVDAKVDVANAPTTCSKFVAAVGASVPVACDQK
jgi:hypothetical protein